MKSVVGEGLQQIIEKRLAETGYQKERQILPLNPLQAEQLAPPGKQPDYKHQKYRRRKT